MKWTHKLPTQAGWYWSRFIPTGRKKETATVILHVTRNKVEIFYRFFKI